MKELIESSLSEFLMSVRKIVANLKPIFKPYNTTQCTEEVLDFHELEIESLQDFYNSNNKIFVLAKQHEDFWERLLHLDEQENNKDRLINN